MNFIRRHWKWLTPAAVLGAWHVWVLTMADPGHVLYRQWVIHFPWDITILLLVTVALYPLRRALPPWARKPLVQGGLVAAGWLLLVSLFEFDDPTFDPLDKSYADWTGHLMNLAAGIWLLKRWWWNIAHQLGAAQAVRQAIRSQRDERRVAQLKERR